jgi:N-acetylglucosaminyl-diphospho-decaprenol L-rhamnosyltransferase
MTMLSTYSAPVSAMGHDRGLPSTPRGLGSAAMPDLAPETASTGPATRATTLSATPVLIVAYGNSADLVGCLEALGHARTTPAFEIFVCENGGPEAYKTLVAALTAEHGPCLDSGQQEELDTQVLVTRHVLRLKGGPDAPLVHLGEAKENLGYAGGVNAWLRPLLRLGGWPAVWVLNPDTQPAPDALFEVARYADHWGKGMVGSRLMVTAQSDRIHSRGLLWRKGRAVAQAVDLHAPIDFEPDPRDVDARLDSPSGASMYVTRACVERIGLMDERYFLLFEDLEWGMRARRHFGIGYAHRSVVVHAGGTTIGSSIYTARQSALSLYLDYRNTILFVRENFPNWLPWTIMVQLARILLKVRANPSGNRVAALRGVLAGLRGESGRPSDVLRNHGRPVEPAEPGRRLQFKRHIKIAVSCVYHALTWPIQALAGLFGQEPRPRLIILYYHGVSASDRAGFARQMDTLGRRATVVGANWRGGPVKGRVCAITFDDAFESMLENALPELAIRRFPCTIFVPTGTMGRAPAWIMEQIVKTTEIVLGQDTIRSLPSELVTFGSHTVSHPFLSRIPREAAREEIELSREMLGAATSRDVRLVSFPYGDYDQEVSAMCEAAGYEFAYSIDPRPVVPGAGEFIRGRVAVQPDDGRLEFFLKMSGSYRWMSLASTIKQAITAPRSFLAATRNASGRLATPRGLRPEVM